MQWSQHPSSIIWYFPAIYIPCHAWPLWTALLLNERRFSESVQYGKHLLRPLPLPDSITFTLSYLTANHPLPSLFTLSLLSLFLLLLFPPPLYLNHCPPSLALWTNSSATFNHKQFKKAFLHPLHSPTIFHFSSRFLTLCVIHFDSFGHPVCQSDTRLLPSQWATVKHPGSLTVSFEGAVGDVHWRTYGNKQWRQLVSSPVIFFFFFFVNSTAI